MSSDIIYLIYLPLNIYTELKKPETKFEVGIKTQKVGNLEVWHGTTCTISTIVGQAGNYLFSEPST